jgi:catechol 2,3-dioxygenase-like lactoylglutathione lyase family enzyme
MKVKMSPNVAVRTSDPQKAYEFYTKILGFRHRPENKTHVDLDANAINLFIIEDTEIQGPVMELFVDDLEEARDILIQNGCKVLRWQGKGQDCYIQDPFGIRFNIWEVKGSIS